MESMQRENALTECRRWQFISSSLANRTALPSESWFIGQRQHFDVRHPRCQFWSEARARQKYQQLRSLDETKACLLDTEASSNKYCICMHRHLCLRIIHFYPLYEIPVKIMDISILHNSQCHSEQYIHVLHSDRERLWQNPRSLTTCSNDRVCRRCTFKR